MGEFAKRGLSFLPDSNFAKLDYGTLYYRAELAAKELISYLQRESNFRNRTRLVAVFVSSQMAGLFIHFIRDSVQWTNFLLAFWLKKFAICFYLIMFYRDWLKNSP